MVFPMSRPCLAPQTTVGPSREFYPQDRILSPEPRIPSPEPRIPSPESRIPSPESRAAHACDHQKSMLALSFTSRGSMMLVGACQRAPYVWFTSCE